MSSPSKPTAKLPLTLEQYAPDRNLPADYLAKTWGLKTVRHDGIDCVEQPYTRMDGTVCAPRYRYGNAKLSPYNSGDSIILYGQKQLVAPESSTCVLVEGESDTQTLAFARYNVLGIPGTSMWDKCIANDPAIVDFLALKTVIIIQEPPSLAEKAKGLDSAAKMVMKIKASLPLSTVVAVRLWEFAPRNSDGEPLYKDVSGLWTYHGGLQGFTRFMDALHIASRAAGKKTTAGEAEIEIITADMVEKERTNWLWADRIPLGMLSEFNGNPDTGKSLILLDIAARGSTGRPMPDSESSMPTFDTLFMLAEDDLSRTVRPRLEVASADLKRIHFAKQTVLSKNSKREVREIALDTDLIHVETRLIENPAIKLVVIDPIGSYLGGLKKNADEHIRPLLTRIKELAEKYQVAFVEINHFNKSTEKAAINRSGGAGAFTAVPRVIWSFIKDTESEDANARTMLNTKGNILGPEGKKGLKYTTEQVLVPMPEGEPLKTPKLIWLGKDERALDDVLSQPKDADRGKKASAKAWLLEFVTARKWAGDIYEEAKKLNHAEETVKSAMRELRSEKRLDTRQEERRWWWFPVMKTDTDWQSDVVTD